MPVVVFSANEDPQVMLATLDAGARGYIPKTRGKSLVSAALLLVAAGDFYVPPEIRRAHELAMTQSVRFTNRQRQVLRGIAQGLSNKQIARSLSIGEETVKHHIKPVFAALGITSRAQAASAVTRHGIKLD